ncbi:MAG: GNAT family N-acetyltransferase [Desulfocapsaceae bacterium]|nr:GNAT family N-acetyltransferase [Desulfocapsaceae bacterium]
MKIELTDTCSGVDWADISEILRRVGMAHYPPDVHKRAFEASHTRVFAWHEGRLAGFGRAISDGEYQAAVYDVAVVPEFQGKGIGSMLMAHILARLAQCNIILYASPGKEAFYETLQFRRMKTGMAHFKAPDAMTEKGFTEGPPVMP